MPELHKNILIAIVLLLLSFPLTSAAGAKEHSTAPAFSLRDIAGAPVQLRDFEGKVVLLTFWAAWCAACKEELPELEALFRKHRDEGFQVIGIAVSSSERAISALLDRDGLTFSVLLDDGTASEAYGCVHLPTSFLIGRDGIIHAVHKGFGKDMVQRHEQEVIELLKLP